MELSREHPFPGLRPFDFRDREFFFGREKHTYALYRLLDRSRFVAVVGSSGSGKSSLVRAGLLPLLGQELDEAGLPIWRCATFHPGDHPMRALRDALVSLAAGADLERDVLVKDVETALGTSSFGLSKAVAEIPGLSDRKLLLVVDQFEELFRYEGSRDEAINFVQSLLEATRSYSSTIHVLITMRSDFIGDCAQFQRLPEAVSRSQFLVPALDREQREEVVLKPIALGEAEIEPLLVERLLNDGGAEMDQLPVLQHCLLRLWESAAVLNETRRLTEKEYDAIGGIAHALSQHADEIMAELGKPLEPAVEAVFRALSETDADGRATRRALSFSKLLAETGIPEADLRRVVERFSAEDCSFLVLSTPALTRETQVDVAHEALLRNWTKISAPLSVKDGRRESGWLAAEATDGWEYRALLSLVRSGPPGAPVTLPLEQVERRYEWWRSRARTAAWAQRYGGGFELVEKLFADSRAELAKQNERERQEAQAEREREAQAQKARRDEEVRRVEEEFARVRARRTLIAAVAMAVLALIALSSAAWALVKDRELTVANDAAATLNAKLSHANAQLQQLNGQKDADIQVKTTQARVLAAQKDKLTAQKNQLAQAGAKIMLEKANLATVNSKLTVTAAQLAATNKRSIILWEEEFTHSQASGKKMLSADVTQHPNDTSARVSLGVYDEVTGDMAGAQQQFLAAHSPNDAFVDASLCDVIAARAVAPANKHSATEKKRLLLQALDNCNTALRLSPNMTYALRSRADVQYDLSLLPGGDRYRTGAVDSVQRALAIDPSEEVSLRYMCELQFTAKDYNAAVAYCTRAAKAYRKSSPTLPVAYLGLGRAEIDKDEYPAAIAALTAAIEIDNKYYDAYYFRAQAETIGGSDLPGAERDFAYVIKNDPQEYGTGQGFYNAHYWLGVAEVKNDDAGAVADLTAALRSKPNDYWTMFWLGRALIQQQNWQAAINDLSHTHEWNTYYYLAYAKLRAGDYRGARPDAQRYISQNPTRGDGYLMLARIELNSGEWSDASANSKKSASLLPAADDKKVALVVADDVTSIGNKGFGPRFAADSNAILANPHDARAYSDRGRVYETIGDRQWALFDYGSAVAANSSDASAFAGKCRLEGENGTIDAALADCDKAAELDPRLASALRQRAIINVTRVGNSNLKQLAAASRDANRAVTLEPQAASSFSTRCFVYYSASRYEEAISDCSTALARDPQLSLPHLWRADARLNTGDYVGGLTDVQTYLRTNPLSADAYLLQARLELRLGSRTQARASAETALRYYKAANDQVGQATAQKLLDDIGSSSLSGRAVRPAGVPDHRGVARRS
ncbi:MAG TPA: tetratricopeptide repeat protein [Candidatus Binatia bacterium]|nr:tetratricopeptide repeat protein [Candidatus Binatia bacterium]